MAQEQQRTEAQLREHYEIEKELADRLRRAAREERRHFYNEMYDELARRIVHHLLIAQATDPAARARAAAPQIRLIHRFVRPDTAFLEVGPGDCAVVTRVAEVVAPPGGFPAPNRATPRYGRAPPASAPRSPRAPRRAAPPAGRRGLRRRGGRPRARGP